MLKIYFLGTGTSQGVPVIGCDCAVCSSTNVLDKRLRTAALISWEDTVVAVDCGPDFRQQMLQSNCKKLDALLFTHEHADHTAGLDDIRPYNFKKGPMPIYADPRVVANLKKRFDYIFETENRYPGAPEVEVHEVIDAAPFELGGRLVKPLKALHGTLPIYGFQVDGLVYMTDVKYVSDAVVSEIKGCEVLVINALRVEEHFTHFNLEEALKFITLVEPKRAYLTHVSHLLGLQEEVERQLPEHVHLAYDNLEILL
ncbi:MAG: MBL fold metallo-hydrolase [Flavobacterium sp.]|nr:MBL fold metallo-hydrolase [Candidatus Neoflavobacterium equi]